MKSCGIHVQSTNWREDNRPPRHRLNARDFYRRSFPGVRPEAVPGDDARMFLQGSAPPEAPSAHVRNQNNMGRDSELSSTTTRSKVRETGSGALIYEGVNKVNIPRLRIKHQVT